MKVRVSALVAGALLGSQIAFAVDLPTSEEIVAGVLEAAGGEAAYHRLGVVEMSVSEEETTSEGHRQLNSYTAYAYAPQADTIRIELSPSVVVTSDKGEGWATKDGDVDTRLQTPRTAVGTIHQKLFPLLLPFSLAMDGVQVRDEVTKTTFDDADAWQLTLRFAPRFFVAPIMNTDWLITVRCNDHALLAAEFLPPVEYRKVQREGVRYRYLLHADVNGVRLPKQVLLDGINFDRIENGHVRVTKIESSVRGPFDPELFVDPRRLEAIEEGGEGVE